jgi:hypothetical protein
LRPPGHNTAVAYAVPTLAEARALHAFSRGDASPEQQKAAFGWIIKRACRAGQEIFVPQQPSSTAYNAGRLSVSLQIGWVLGQPVEAFRNGETD